MKLNILNLLPQEIKLNIFSRLPVDSVLPCKLVCRSWRDLLQFHTNTFFAYQHLERQHGRGLLTTQQDDQQSHDSGDVMSFITFNRVAQKFYYEEYHEKDNEIMDNQPQRIDLEFSENVRGIVGSCNGLVCLTVERNYMKTTLGGDTLTYTTSEPLYVCNPVTREFVTLPKLWINDNESRDEGRTAFGFGYHPLTKEYKVIRICYLISDDGGSPIKGNVAVYTLGKASGWRRIGDFNYRLWNEFLWTTFGSLVQAPGICVNGVLYWLQGGSSEIVAFELADEEFHLLPAAPCRLGVELNSRKLCVMKGCLCLVYQYSSHGDYYLCDWGLWFLKKNKENENKIGCHTKEQCYKSYGWTRECSLQLKLKCKVHAYNERLNMLSAVTKGGDILLAHCGTFCSYNQMTGTVKDIRESRKDFLAPVSHIHSFVSLKALGEKDVKPFKGSSARENKDVV